MVLAPNAQCPPITQASVAVYATRSRYVGACGEGRGEAVL